MRFEKVRVSRTNLILLMSRELYDNKKKSLTMINSRSLIKAEKEYTKQNNQVINLKSETFSSCGLKQTECNFGRNQIKNSSDTLNNKYFLKVPSIKLSNTSSLKLNESDTKISSKKSSGMDCSDDVLENLSKRTSVSGRKNEFFREKMLNKVGNVEETLEFKENDTYMAKFFHQNVMRREKNIKTIKNLIMKKVPRNELEKNLEFINNNTGFIKYESTRNRTKQGFVYLQKLCKRIKKPKNERQSMINLLEGMRDILYIKDRTKYNYDEWNIHSDFGRHSSFIIMFNRQELPLLGVNPKKIETCSFKENRQNFANMNERKRYSYNNILQHKLQFDLHDKKSTEKEIKFNQSFEYYSHSGFSIELNNCEK